MMRFKLDMISGLLNILVQFPVNNIRNLNYH